MLIEEAKRRTAEGTMRSIAVRERLACQRMRGLVRAQSMRKLLLFWMLAGCGNPVKGPHPKTLPFSYTRPQSGTPESADELTMATDAFVDLFQKTNYFGAIDDRVHGWPK